MIPTANIDIKTLELKPYPSLTYSMSSGLIDRVEALRESIYRILNTERYDYVIYSWDYGIELKDLIGEDAEYIKIVLPVRIEEALKQDDRILGVEDFEFKQINNKSLLVSFVVNSVFGDVEINKEVNI